MAMPWPAMRSLLRRFPCTTMLLLAAVIREAAATYGGRDLVHKVSKLHDNVRMIRRDSTLCPTNYNLCPASLGGGCCPGQYACATDSCYATTAGPTTACGKANFYACAADVGGGCCPVGLVCAKNNCVPPDGVAFSQSCPINYFLCPSSLGYGCCQNGMGCASNACYATTPSTNTITQVVTTTASNSVVLTTTVVATSIARPTPPTAVPTSGTGAVAKFTPSTVAKISASGNPSSGAGDGTSGLTGPQIGGIVGGAVVLLIVVLVATFFILRRLKKTAIAVESQANSSGRGPQMHRHTPAASEVEAISVDQPLIFGTPATRSIKPGGMRSRAPSETTTDPLDRQNPFNTPSRDPTPASVNGYYNAVPTSESSDGVRHPSVDSYFDIPLNNKAIRQSQQSGQSWRVSYDSQADAVPSNRHLSYTSEMSAEHGTSELDAGEESSRRRSSSITTTARSGHINYTPSELDTNDGVTRKRSSSALSISRPPLASHRRGSDGHTRVRSDSSAPGAPLQLGTVSEFAEIHGYYGPTDHQAGQMPVGLVSGDSVGSTDHKEVAKKSESDSDESKA